ncbi:unnamed protein product [Trifolium pratense]|uniref:Uncharacterized protein n=1 Tax=Trifolium pratense TaxID=57577 RepID=A0ACB0J1G1_TRIPR|nr:unnamed protein product [Trifolium pratense]
MAQNTKLLEPFSTPIPSLEHFSSGNIVCFKSREKASDQLFDALQDESCSTIGLYGREGSGKTTLVKAMGDKVKYLEIFHEVLFVKVPQNTNIRTMQDEIAELLNMKFDKDSEAGRAIKILSTIQGMNRKILVIFDDVRAKFDPEDIGIPCDDNSCKILLTTCCRQDCELMSCQREIQLDPLSREEARSLFMKHSGIRDDEDNSSSFDLLNVAREAAFECEGLPRTIKEVGSFLRSKPIEEWKTTLAKELIETMAHNEYRVQNDRGAKKKGGLLELDTQDAVLAQTKLLSNQMEAFMKRFDPQQQVKEVQELRCDFCQQGQANGGCFPEGSEEAKYLANFRKPYPNGWGSNSNQGQGYNSNPPPPKPSEMEETLTSFMKMTQGNFEAIALENQMCQLSKQVSSLQNQSGFGGNTTDNPKNETCHVISLRSREVPSPVVKESILKKKVSSESEGEVEKNEGDVVVENSKEEKASEQLFVALKDDNCSMIGLYGRQGSGKTTLAKAMGEKVKYLKIFHEVLFATVTQNPNIRIMQDEIADSLNMKFDKNSEAGRASRILSTIESMNCPILVIFDDVRAKFDPKDLGIPCNSNRCKILLTTFCKQDCDLMYCQRDIQLDVSDVVVKWLEETNILISQLDDLNAQEIPRKQFKRLLKKVMAQNTKLPDPISTPIPTLEHFASGNIVCFNYREKTSDQLLDALQDESCSTIGLYGSEGFGKTTLVKAMGDKVDPSDIRHLRKCYGEGMARHENNYGINSEKVLKWKLALVEVSNLSVKTYKTGEIQLDPLSTEEAWFLFMKHSVIHENNEYSSSDLSNVARDIAFECEGLPRTIIDVGSTLRNKPIVEWKTTLDSLKHSMAKWQIFLSFRGEDTRYSFTGFLYQVLCQGGFKTFMDDGGLQTGDQISPSLLNAIEASRLSIIVLSENYVNSSWCLEELVKILECMKLKNQLVWPIFYKVEPSDIRHLRKHYGKDMAHHENNFGINSERVQKWKSALFEVSNLSGKTYTIGYEYEFIQKIVEDANRIKSRLQIRSI